MAPAYREGWICASSDGHLQATGRDARGRKQYRYHPKWTAARDAGKYDRLRAFGRTLPRLRICNAEYQQANGSFGLSTLRKRHAGTLGALVQPAFVGKSGVPQRARLEDRRVARIVRRCQDLPGQQLFHYLDVDGAQYTIGSGDVDDWLAEISGQDFTAKDFRTWHGTVRALALALALALARQAARGVAGAPNSAAAVVAEVARCLGNTPAVCRKAYIHPRVLQQLDDEAGARRRRQEKPSLRKL